MSCAPSRIRRCPTRKAPSTRGATWSGWTSSSSWPTWRWPSGASSGSRPPGATAPSRSATPTSARRRSCAGSTTASSKAGRSATRSLSADDEKAIRGFRFLTQKPVLVLLNVGEADIPREAELVAGIATRYDHRHALVDALSAKIEMELGELDPAEAGAFMEELGLEGSSLDRVIALSYRLLGLISFLTAGPDEVRAWPVPDGSTAVDAAGTIHTDLAKGFIRAETVGYADLLELRSTAEARKHGKLRSEGKTYVVRDGDVIEILFSR